MNILKLIRYLSNPTVANAPAAKTIAAALGITEKMLTDTIETINEHGIFKISAGKGGGRSISGGLKKEKDVYAHVEKHTDAWVKSEIFGHRGVTGLRTNPTYKKKLSGKWSNPDLTALCVHKFLHAPQNWIELVTLEVKHAPSQFNVSCVYEALAHTRVSSYSVLFFYEDPSDTINDRNEQVALEEIKLECVRLGIGLVISQYPCDISTWQYIIPARMHEPDIRRIDAFIADAFDQEDKNWLKKLL